LAAFLLRWRLYTFAGGNAVSNMLSNTGVPALEVVFFLLLLPLLWLMSVCDADVFALAGVSVVAGVAAVNSSAVGGFPAVGALLICVSLLLIVLLLLLLVSHYYLCLRSCWCSYCC
jgi:hypothetical protein